MKLQLGPLRVCIWMAVVWVVPGLFWGLTGLFGDSNLFVCQCPSVTIYRFGRGCVGRQTAVYAVFVKGLVDWGPDQESGRDGVPTMGNLMVVVLHATPAGVV
jgi:hypothetical protein